MKTVLAFVEETTLRAELEAALALYGYHVRFAKLDDTALPAADVLVVDVVRGVELKLRRLAARHSAPLLLLVADVDEPLPHPERVAAFALKPLALRELRMALRVAMVDERRAMAREQWFQTSMRSIADAVILADETNHITFMNSTAERLTGWREEEAIGLALDGVFQVEPVDERDRTAARADSAAQLLRLLRRGGVSCIIDQTAAPIVDDGGQLLGIVVVFKDITERRQLEQRLAIADRMAALGTVAAGIAHELNNPLAYAMANIGFVLDDVSIGLDEPARNALVEANDGVVRAARVVKDMRLFMRDDAAAPVPVDVNGAISLAARLTRAATDARAPVELDLEDVPKVVAAEAMLVQMFGSLLTNASKAIDPRSAQKHIRVSSRSEGGGVVVRISDTGVGIAPDQLEHVFEPFFTTRGIGQGLGLGLSMAWAVVDRFGGTIAVESVVGQGTTVIVSLPANNQSEPKEA